MHLTIAVDFIGGFGPADPTTLHQFASELEVVVKNHTVRAGYGAYVKAVAFEGMPDDEPQSSPPTSSS